MIQNSFKKIEGYAKHTGQFIDKESKSVFSKYPLLFSFLVLFGATATAMGLEELIRRISFLGDRPLLLFIIGSLILIFTGTLYKTLHKKMNPLL